MHRGNETLLTISCTCHIWMVKTYTCWVCCTLYAGTYTIAHIRLKRILWRPRARISKVQKFPGQNKWQFVQYYMMHSCGFKACPSLTPLPLQHLLWDCFFSCVLTSFSPQQTRQVSSKTGQGVFYKDEKRK